MKNLLFVLFAFVCTLLTAQAQESTTQHLVRSGIGYQRPYLVYATPPSEFSIGIMRPSYIRINQSSLWQFQLPSISYSQSDMYKKAHLGLQISYAYVFTPTAARFRPFLGYNYQFSGSYSKTDNRLYYNSPDLSLGTSTRINTQHYVLPTLGFYYRLTNNLFLDLTLEAPTGHAILSLHSYRQLGNNPNFGGSSMTLENLPRINKSMLPNVQIGISYRIK